MYIFISAIILWFMMKLFIDALFYKENYARNSLEGDRFSNCIIAIESTLNRAQLKSWEIQNNRLKIYYSTLNKCAEIGIYDADSLGIYYYSDGNLITVNRILRDVKEVKFIQKGRIIYFFVKIKDKSYEEIFTI